MDFLTALYRTSPGAKNPLRDEPDPDAPEPPPRPMTEAEAWRLFRTAAPSPAGSSPDFGGGPRGTYLVGEREPSPMNVQLRDALAARRERRWNGW